VGCFLDRGRNEKLVCIPGWKEFHGMIASPPKTSDKILPLEDLAGVLGKLKAQGKTVVHCHGVFDLMHVGHIRHFEQAKGLGDILIVTVTPDRYVNKGPNRPVFTDAHRAWAIAALGCVDYVAVNRWPTAIDTIKLLQPSIFVKGSEYRDASKDRTGNISLEEQSVRDVGGRIEFTDDIVFSSSSLINRYFGVFPEKTEQFLTAFSAKHGADQILHYLEAASKLKVLVLGETIIDEYQYCETLGKAGKEPILVARHISSERFPGGILAVANHVAAICDQVTMLSCLGEIDSQEDFVREHTQAKIEKIFLTVPGVPTIVKTRFLESYPFQKLFEVYVMGNTEQQSVQTAAVGQKLSEILPNYDAVIVADYGHGMISPEVADVLSGAAKFLAINTQVNAGNHGFNTVSKYQRADYVSVSERELRLEARSPHRDLREIVKEVSAQLGAERLMITRGGQGCLCYSRSEGFHEIPAFTGHVVDRVGAGDAVLAITALCAAQQAPIDVLGFIGNCVGSQAVGIVGNRSAIERVSLARYIECLLK
jgi:rfaE bifunctional protein kinase chain/domain/rfaE bifunctional protein nucleotidyltransferase chain/domain